MANIFGIDYGDKQRCRVCQTDRFIVERGSGKKNGEDISVLMIRCARCGTPLECFQVNWTGNPDDKVEINDGVIREAKLGP